MKLSTVLKNILQFKLALLVPVLLLSQGAQAQDTTRNGYNLFKPLPKPLMREDMETDRPSITESPYTVEAGHFQYEADLFKHERETTEESKQHKWLINQANLKFGLLKNTALQVIVQSYGKERTEQLADHSMQSASGFGDITLRLKQNIYGNYNGNFSIALLPYVKFPTNKYSENKLYEEGLMIPMVIKLPHDWKIGLQVEGDYLKDNDEQARHAEVLQSLVLSHVLFKKLEVFGETFYTYNFKDHQIQNYLDAALEYELIKDVKVDAGINYGLQKTAHKDYFLGIAFRY
jgi:hypothetical protein